MNASFRQSIVAGAIASALVPATVFACSCGDMSAKEAYASAHFVFSGSVVATDMFYSPRWTLEEWGYGTFLQRTAFSIERVWKGPNVNGFVFETERDDGANCGVDINEGDSGVRVGYFGADEEPWLLTAASTNSCSEDGSWGIERVLDEGTVPLQTPDCRPLVCPQGAIHSRCDSEGKLVEVAPTCGGDFSDVRDEGPMKDAVEWMAERGFIKGHVDGTFRPDASINRAEFATIITRLSFQSRLIDTCVFERDIRLTDVADDAWYAKPVCALRKIGAVQGYPDRTYRPAQSVSVAEAAKILIETMDPDEYSSKAEIWWQPYINTLKGADALPAGYTLPEAVLTRGQFATMFRAYYETKAERAW